MDENLLALFQHKNGKLTAKVGWQNFFCRKDPNKIGSTPNSPGKILGFSIGISEFIVMKRERFHDLQTMWKEGSLTLATLLGMIPAPLNTFELGLYENDYILRFKTA